MTIPRHQAKTRRALILGNLHKNRNRCSTHVEGFQCSVKKFQYKACHKFGHFTSHCYQKKQAPFKSRRPKAHQLQAEQCMHKREPYATTLKVTVPVMIPFACRSKCSAHKLV